MAEERVPNTVQCMISLSLRFSSINHFFDGA